MNLDPLLFSPQMAPSRFISTAPQCLPDALSVLHRPLSMKNAHHCRVLEFHSHDCLIQTAVRPLKPTTYRIDRAEHTHY